MLVSVVRIAHYVRSRACGSRALSNRHGFKPGRKRKINWVTAQRCRRSYYQQGATLMIAPSRKLMDEAYLGSWQMSLPIGTP